MRIRSLQQAVARVVDLRLVGVRRADVWLAMLGLVAVVTTSGCSASSSSSCGLVACNSTASIKGYATLGHDDMATATITACRNSTCTSGTPASLPTAPNDRLQITMTGAVASQGFISTPDGAKGYKVEVSFSIDDQNVKSGDHYELKIVKADGTAVNTYAGDATYQELAPNGKDCPPFCKTATIDKSL